MGSKSSRREFLKQAAIAGAGVAASTVTHGPANAAEEKSRVIVIRNPRVLTPLEKAEGEEFTSYSINGDLLAQMIDEAVAKLMKVSKADAAWKMLFKPDDVVGIKVNCLFGPHVSTHPEVAHSVANSIIKSGVKPEKVIIWDRSTRDLVKTGYKINTDGPGVRVLANDREWEEQPTTLGSFTGKLTKIVTRDITALVNIPIMKDHGGAGISGALKNHYGTCDNPGELHGNNCHPYLADLNAVPAIKDKTRLVVMDALRPMCNGGPGLRREHLWEYHGIVAATDPVALDYFAWKTIEARRSETGLKSLAEAGREPKWIAGATERGLGNSDPSKMELIYLG